MLAMFKQSLIFQMSGKSLILKATVHASMKKLSYIVYVHLDQVNGDVVHGRSLKAGKGGQCNHVAAMLYQIIDYVQFKQSLIVHKLIGKSCQPIYVT